MTKAFVSGPCFKLYFQQSNNLQIPESLNVRRQQHVITSPTVPLFICVNVLNCLGFWVTKKRNDVLHIPFLLSVHTSRCHLLQLFLIDPPLYVNEIWAVTNHKEEDKPTEGQQQLECTTTTMFPLLTIDQLDASNSARQQWHLIRAKVRQWTY